MTAYMVTPPASLPVTLAEMKAHMNVAHDDDDVDIQARIASAVADLDGIGLLGRCIMPQTWAMEVTGPGPHLLPFPDASNITAQADGASLAVDVARTASGQSVTVSEALADQAVTLQFVCGLPAHRLPAAQMLVKLLVHRDFDQMAGPEYDAHTRTIQGLINSLRWRRI